MRFGRSASLTGRLPQSEGNEVRGQKVAGRRFEVERSQDSPESLESPGKAPFAPVAPGKPRQSRPVGIEVGSRSEGEPVTMILAMGKEKSRVT